MQPSDRSRLRRRPDRGSYDRDVIHAILDQAPVCHVGFAVDIQPFVIPTLHGRRDDRLFLHGARASRLLKHAAAGYPLCVTATIVDGLVLARSVFHHSMNYRSVVLFGNGRLLERDDEKLAALYAISEHMLPGRWDDARQPTPKELGATSVIEFAIDEATAKVRSGPPKDDEEDYALPVWAGVLPYRTVAGPPEPDPGRRADVPLPGYLESASR
jgi:nitroimidazol reductase NimA-like FMN-containing flavoprotein (pyridoxamine 5'-phosphate oxidase superfamily)